MYVYGLNAHHSPFALLLSLTPLLETQLLLQCRVTAFQLGARVARASVVRHADDDDERGRDARVVMSAQQQK